MRGSGRLLEASLAWKTDKLVESMTSKRTPAPKMSFRSVLERSGPGLAKKSHEFPRKCSFFAEKWTILDENGRFLVQKMDDSLTQVGRPWPEVHPPKLKDFLSASPTDPFGVPNPEWHKRMS